ncbi:xanthine dehydrogenase family protein molybdopterin-binding subunit [Muricoccus pecuniae]|uniref:Carbon-monoxide dehydrogenase large subunit n=1 Tax=Muricoccus pecuniae TaxID=693023 RepID=A0A840YLS6_9PROT|nr:xanthine dehydrogenase family protein molybdopterin-binding subunit [Roseomonas pecuniae]MBB5695763.1 carbon-monoxide dehydrogenase large subunit [Roseomonas pecuniae]
MDNPLSDLDRPNSYIGRSVPRPNAARLLAGQGRYVDDLRLPRMLHAAFLRSPFAHARIVSVDTAAARAMQGVAGVFTRADMDGVCTPWVGTLAHFTGLKSAPQGPLAGERATWQGEPVAIVCARSRAEAEDAAALIDIEWEELEPLPPLAAALEAAPLHPELRDNLAFTRAVDVGGADSAFALEDSVVVEAAFRTGRHTGVTLEPRAILADWQPGEEKLTVHHSFQAPHMMREVLSKHLALPEAAVRVVCGDVGGSFGIKVHIYPDEIATCVASRLLGRPVKFIADRLESFTSDIHCRDHEVAARLAVGPDGRLRALEMDDVTGIGPYSVYPRTSAVEGNQVVNLTGSWYALPAYKARLRVAFQTRTPTCQYRAVGHPVAVAVTEGLMDLAAERLGMDPAALRRLNLIPDDAYPHTSPAGLRFEALSLQKSFDKLLAMMDYDALRRDQAEARSRGVYRGIGLASFVELTNPGPAFYGIGGAPISAQDGTMVRLDPGGSVTVSSSVTEQGQGTEAVLAQVVAHQLSIPVKDVRVVTGDTERTPYGGGTWASRGAGIGGESALQAARALKANILALAGAVMQADPSDLDLRDGQVVDAAGAPRMAMAEVGRLGYFRVDLLPPGFQPEFSVIRHWLPRQYPFAFTNGAQASYLEVDPDTGFVKLLGHWVVEDCGTVINPLLVDEQVRGGVVQGIGAALLEECLYDERDNLLTGSMADYLVPMMGEMPDIAVGHVETPTKESVLGAKGAGEAGTAGAPAAVMNAINDALRPLGAAKIQQQPATPERILRALGKV